MGNDTSQLSKPLKNDIVIKWEKSADKCPFPPREGQASAVIGCKLYLFGGVVFSQNKDNNTGEDFESNDLLVYDVESEIWSKEECSGACPSQRSGATMASIGKCLYLFGGLSQLSGWMNDLYVCNTETKIWRQINADHAPSPRDKVMSAVAGCKLYIFGGFGPVHDDNFDPEDILPIDSDNDNEYEDMDELHEIRNCQEAANFSWSDQLYEFCSIAEKWLLLKPNDCKIPSPRAAHSLTFVSNFNGEESLYVFGGRDIESRQNDLWKYDIKLCKWEQVQGLGLHPQPRSFHAACSVGKRLIIHGGRAVNNQHFDDFNIFDVETNEWFQLDLSNMILNSQSEAVHVTPMAMGLHTLCIVDGKIVLYGGSSELDPATGTCTKFNNYVYQAKADDVLIGKAITNENAIEPDGIKVASIPDMVELKPTSTIQQNAPVN